MRWLRRIRGTLGTGLTWAFGWALAGIGIGVTSLLTPFLPWDAFFDVFDAPLPAFAVPGFFGGIIYSIVVGIAGRQRRFEDLTMAGVARWGALGGVLLACLPSAMMAVGLASGNPENLPSLPLPLVLAPVFAPLGAASAAVTLWIARRARSRSALSAADEMRALPDESAESYAQRAAAPSKTSASASHTRD